MKEAVYSGTKNLYDTMEVAAKSLIANSSVDQVHFLIEDKKFPHELPDLIKCQDVSGQGFFPKDGPNMKSWFSYMALLRVCYTYLFPDTEKILQLDVDTVCVNNIDEIWDTRMGNCWVAAVEEYHSTYKPYGPLYYNIGVALFDLAKMRSIKIDDKLIDFLNTTKLSYVDQDAINRLARRIATLNVRYNESVVTGFTDNPAIVHYAGYKKWKEDTRVPRREYFTKYENMSWDEVLKLHKENCKK